MNLRKIYFFLLLFTISQTLVFSQTNIWTKTTQINNYEEFEKFQLNINEVEFFEIESSELQRSLLGVPKRASSKKVTSKSYITLPTTNGGLEVFEIYEVSVFAPELAEKYPNIKSYVGFSKTNPEVKLRMSNSPLGLETLIIYPNKQNLYMQPVTHGGTSYVLYQSDNLNFSEEGFECGVLDTEYNEETNKASTAKNANDQLLRKLRLAVSTTGEYTAFFGGTKAGALAGINTVVNRINEVFETDVAATFEVIANTDEVIFTDATTDPYADVQDDWNSTVQTTLTAVIGEENYDIGHLLSPLTGSGVLGNAGCIGCVCEDGRKGSAFSRPLSGNPDGPRFEETFIHELGHQMGATHTYSAGSEGPNFTQTEPGAGSTIMGTGAAGSPVTDSRGDYFHYFSIFQITNNIASKSCPTTTPIANNPPVANAGSDFIIPSRTAYVLRGSATDPDGTDNLFYTWEQLDVGIVTSGTFGPNSLEGAMNRSLPPATNPDRYIPNIPRVLAGQLTETGPARGDDWETVSNVSRDLNWGLTVRDREATGLGLGGQTDSDEMVITVTADAGPFTVTSQNGPVAWDIGSSQDITWFVGGTDANGINTSNVNILLSQDGGQTYPVTLASNVPNNGSYTIPSVPNNPCLNCRVKVEPVDNIYYAVNTQNFTIGNFIQDCTQYSSASNLNLAIPEGAGFLGPLPGTPLETTLNVSSSTIIESITLFTDISHSNISNIDIELIHPNGIDRVKVWDLTCNDENDLSILFDDDAASAIICDEPTTGTYQPLNALSVFDGLDATGDWTLRVIDYRTSDTGVLNNWYIEVCGLVPETLETSEFNFASEVVLFPNPNEGSFNLKLNSTNSNTIDVEVFDLRGRNVYKKQHPSSGGSFDESINLSGVEAGLYLVNIKDGNLKASKKIIVK